MKKVSIAKLTISIMLVLLMTSCTSLESRIGESVEVTTEQVSETTTTTTEDTTLLIEFNDYTITENDDGTFNITITQEAVEDRYYTMSLMYDDRIVEYVSGDGYYESAYGSFDEETIVTDSTDTERVEPSVTTLSKDELEARIGKEGKWVLKSTSEGTQYVEIKLLNSYGDVCTKYQLTCIVDTHLEPHLYYTTINY
jgi:hypothetical protein